MTESRYLYDKVIVNGYCIGCGNCATVTGSVFKTVMDEYGNIVARINGDPDRSEAKVLSICPFSGKSKNEDELSDIFFPDVIEKNSKIGRFFECFAGYVNEGDFREKGGSGGFGKWLGYTLLKENKIDFFISVFPNQTGDPSRPLFDFTVISNPEDVLKASKSAYYPVTLVEVIKTIRENNGRYAITGIPCFVKSLRLISLEDKNVNERIKFLIGIVCGGMKSANHSKIIGWQLGVKPDNLVAIDFRRKHKDKPASYKIYQVWSNTDNIEHYKDAGAISGTDWGGGYFKPHACDYCDDVVAETADVSFGDAWLPDFESDPKGTSMIIVRNKEILDLLNLNSDNLQITLFNLSPTDVIKAQEGGFRHRHEALSFRLLKKEAENQWYPNKRIKAGEFKISRKREKIYTLREMITAQSHISGLKAINSNDLNVFLKEIGPLARKYYIALHGNMVLRGFRKLRRMFFGK